MLIFTSQLVNGAIQVELKENPNVSGFYQPGEKRLNLSVAQIGDGNLPDVLQFLEEHPEIKQLILYGNNISDVGAWLLSRNTTLTYLDLSKNHITEEGCRAFSQNTTLLSLDLGYNELDNSAVKALLSGNKNLTTLTISGNLLLDDTIVESLLEHGILTTLNLHNNSLSDAFATKLALHPRLSGLDISSNQIGDKGVRALIKQNRITRLNISNNVIGSSGCEALVSSRSVLYLEARQCGISGKDANRFIQNKTLLSLDMTHNPGVSDDLLTALKVHVAQNLKKYDLARDLELKRGAVLTYLGFLLVNLQKNHLPRLPQDIVNIIADFSNAMVSESLKVPIPPIHQLSISPELVRKSGFFLPKKYVDEKSVVAKKYINEKCAVTTKTTCQIQ